MLNTETKNYIFSDDSSLIATEIEDEMLLNIMDKAKSGEKTGKVSFKSGSGVQIANYRYIEEHNRVIVNCDSKSHIFSSSFRSLRQLRRTTITLLPIYSRS